MTEPGNSRRGPKARPKGLGALGGFLARRARFAAAAWIVAVGALAIIGQGLSGELQAHPLFIKGTNAQRAHEITLRKFQSDESLVVVLRGPRRALERQGRALVADLGEIPKTLAISPWSPGRPLKGLRPNPQVAGIVVKVGRHPDETMSETLEAVESRIEEAIAPPVKAGITGLPKVFDSFSKATADGSKTGEMIAVPILLLVLLLVFRSVIAALIPLLIGGAVVAGTQGVMRLLLGVVEVDAFALGAASMMGLALGVDYSLLVVSRLRQERETYDLPTAVRVTVETTGRSIVPAGLGLLLAMFVASQILPGVAVKSSALAIMVATALSMVSALWMAPATVALLGDNLDRLSLPKRYALRGGALRVANRISRHPVALAVVIFAVLFLAGWAATLSSSVASPSFLPPGSSGRTGGEEVEQSLGPGWLAPIEVVAQGRGEPMTSPKQLHSLVVFQKQVEGDSGVQTMAGFAGVERSVRALSGFEDRLVRQQHQIARLGSGVDRMSNGASASVDGLREAAAGAGRLGGGVGSAAAGAGMLATGLDRARTGSRELSHGLGRTADGSGQLADGSSKVGSDSGRLADALETAQKQSTELDGTVQATRNAMQLGEARLEETQEPLKNAEARLAAARAALERIPSGDTDPNYRAAQQAVEEAGEYLSGPPPEAGEPSASAGVGAGLTRAQRQFNLGLYLAEKIEKNNEKASDGTGKLADASRKLHDGIERLAGGTAKISAAISRLSRAGDKLSPALRRLGEGTESLAGGLGELGAKAGELAGGLESGAQGQETLVEALNRMGSGLDSQSANGSSQLNRMQSQSPGLFDSGYFYLAGLDGANPRRREQAQLMVDLEQGGHTVRMLVIPRYPATTSQGQQTLELVGEQARQLGRKTGSEVVVGGLTASEIELNRVLRDRSLVLRIALMLITLLVLVPVMRSLIMPIIAMFINLLTVTASMGVLSLLFDHGMLGGPGYVDTSIVPAMVMVMFGLALDYEVFVFARMREEYVRTGSTTEAIDNGLARTAPVVTGAALIMIVVFLAFSVSSFVTMRNFGVGQATAVFIDAFIIRLIIVPAIMRALGKWSWWMPGWLDRLIPGGGEPASIERA